jgi:hypothetical protein
MLGENKRTNTNSPGPHARDVGDLTNITSYSDTPVVPPLRAGDFVGFRLALLTICSFNRAQFVVVPLDGPIPYSLSYPCLFGIIINEFRASMSEQSEHIDQLTG